MIFSSMTNSPLSTGSSSGQVNSEECIYGVCIFHKLTGGRKCDLVYHKSRLKYKTGKWVAMVDTCSASNCPDASVILPDPSNLCTHEALYHQVGGTALTN